SLAAMTATVLISCGVVGGRGVLSSLGMHASCGRARRRVRLGTYVRRTYSFFVAALIAFRAVRSESPAPLSTATARRSSSTREDRRTARSDLRIAVRRL